MLLPSLFQLAVKSVAQQIHNENFPSDFHLDTKSSNAVVRELLELNPKNIEKLKTHKNQLSRLRELNLSECEHDVESISNLKNFKLNSLEFGNLYYLKTEFPDPEHWYSIDIVSLLERAVNTDSRKMMVHLGFTGEEEAFMKGWEKKVSKLFPSLQSLKIIGTIFCQHCQLSNLCNSFPNLRTLDISSAGDLSALNGIKNLTHLQKFVMRGLELEINDGYEELSELKNLRVLDVSGERYSNVELWVIRGLLQAQVRIENLELLDCSMTFFEDHELREFVENHPKLKTVAAISTRCDNLHIPTIDLLNNNSIDSTIKSLEYAITNDRKDLTEVCIRFITDKLDRIHDQLNDSEISGFLNVLRYALIESKYELIKCLAIQCFATSSFFETERFFKSFWLEITGIVELLFTSCKHLKRSEIRRKIAISWILTVFERMVDFLKFGNILQDRLLNFIMEKAIELSCQYPEKIRKVTFILIVAHRFMSLDQYTEMCNNKKVIKELFDFSHRLITLDPSSYKQVMELIVRCLNQASESTLNYLVSNCQAVEKCYEKVMIVSQSPSTDSQKNLSKIVLRLMSVINLNNPDEKAKALTSCSILSLLLAKNLIDDREYINTVIGEFNDSWGRSKILAYQNITEVMNAIFTSEYSTDESIRFGLMLTSTFVNAKICESTEYWNWVRTTLEYIGNNEMCTKKTRESASAVLNEMSTIEKK